MSDTAENSKGKCPVMHGANKVTATGAIANHHWWPEQLNLKNLIQIYIESQSYKFYFS